MDEANYSDASDPLLSGARRSRNKTQSAKKGQGDSLGKKSREKKGLDAEDDFGHHDRDNDADDSDIPDDPEHGNDEEAEGSGEDEDDGSGDDEPVDSEFEESDDGEGDDYNAENYFDTGEGDDDDGLGFGGGGGDEGGEYF